MYKFKQSIKHIKGKIKKWNKEECDDIFKSKREIENQMEKIQQSMILEGRKNKTITGEASLQAQPEDIGSI
jgi:hypothetical protein